MIAVPIYDASGTLLGTAYLLTPEEQTVAAAASAAAAAAATEREAKRAAIRADVAGVINDLQAGTLTYGSNSRDNAIKRIARAARFLLTGDDS